MRFHVKTMHGMAFTTPAPFPKQFNKLQVKYGATGEMPSPPPPKYLEFIFAQVY